MFSGLKVKSAEKQYKVSLCAIFKNEAPYLKEWIEFHRIVGIDHFYLYNNNSEDDYLSVLQPYMDLGLVTLTQWPKQQAQNESYHHCIQNYRNETQWIGFVDLDEFVVPIEKDNIYDFLKPFETNRGSVKIYWKTFGSSGLIERDISTLVTETFTIAWPKYNAIGKCFYNTNFDFDFNYYKNCTLFHMLWTNYKGKPIPPVNAFGNFCMNEYDKVKPGVHPIQINHYATKSYKEYLLKKSRGDAFYKINPHTEESFYKYDISASENDYSAYKNLIKLKLSMNG